jgi:hypothetical protein
MAASVRRHVLKLGRERRDRNEPLLHVVAAWAVRPRVAVTGLSEKVDVLPVLKVGALLLRRSELRAEREVLLSQRCNVHLQVHELQVQIGDEVLGVRVFDLLREVTQLVRDLKNGRDGSQRVGHCRLLPRAGVREEFTPTAAAMRAPALCRSPPSPAPSAERTATAPVVAPLAGEGRSREE